MKDSYIMEAARRYAIQKHNLVNHLYDGRPYSYHLEKVVNIGNKFIYLIPEKDRNNVIGGLWCHDVIEDTRQTWNDVRKYTNEFIANFAFALTNEKGKTRKDRANSNYYKGIRRTKYATFGKLCDRIGNIKHNLEQGGSMLETYKKEHNIFVSSLKKTWWEKLFYKEPCYKDMFEYLEKLIK